MQANAVVGSLLCSGLVTGIGYFMYRMGRQAEASYDWAADSGVCWRCKGTGVYYVQSGQHSIRQTCVTHVYDPPGTRTSVPMTVMGVVVMVVGVLIGICFVAASIQQPATP